MPLPVSHSLAGISVFAAADRGSRGRAVWRLLAAVFVANAPDLDLLPGMLWGDPNRYHHGATHSLLSGVAVGVGVGLILGVRRGWPVAGIRKPLLGTVAMIATLWGSHVVLDALTHDPSPPVGVPMFWPLSHQRVSIAPLFERADKLAGPTTASRFLGSLLSAHNVRAAAIELLLLGPITAWLYWRRRRRRSECRSLSR